MKTNFRKRIFNLTDFEIEFIKEKAKEQASSQSQALRTIIRDVANERV